MLAAEQILGKFKTLIHFIIGNCFKACPREDGDLKFEI